MEVADVRDGGGQAGGNGESALKRRPAKRKMEHSLLFSGARLPVGAGHSELIEVGQEGEGGAGEGGGDSDRVHLNRNLNRSLNRSGSSEIRMGRLRLGD